MRTKTFDCVVMKHEILQRLKREAAGQPGSQRSEDLRRRIAADPHLMRLLESVAVLRAENTCSATMRPVCKRAATAVL